VVGQQFAADAERDLPVFRQVEVELPARRRIPAVPLEIEVEAQRIALGTFG
jgi:hypothetical protein